MAMQPTDRDLIQHHKAFDALQKAKLKSTLLEAAANRPKAKPADKKALQDAMEGVKKASAALSAAAPRAFALEPPKGLVEALHHPGPGPGPGPHGRTLHVAKPPADAPAAAESAPSESLWDRVRSFFQGNA